MIRRALCLLAVLFLLLPPEVVLAGEGDGVDPGEVWNVDGSIRWENLSGGEIVEVPIDLGFPIKLPLPGGGEWPLYDGRMNLAFQRFTTPSGDTVLIPNMTTLFVMNAFPEAVPEEVVNYDLGLKNMLVEGYGDTLHFILSQTMPDVLAQIDALRQGYRNEQDFYRDLLQGKINIWSSGLRFFKEMARLLIENDWAFMGWAVLLYDGNLALDEGGVAGGDQPPPWPAWCPLNLNIDAPPPVVTARQVAPVRAITVGQDPEKRGADLEISVTVPPVVVTYQRPRVEIRTRTVCQGYGSPQPGMNECTPNVRRPGRYYYWTEEQYEERICEPVREVHQDPIRYVDAWLELAESSRRWITGELAQRYPGARVYQGSMWLEPLTSPYGRTSWTHTWERLQLRDPGYWNIMVFGYTQGTPWTDPRPIGSLLEPQGAIEVWLLETTLASPFGP